ncbi:hypothetical protein DFO55_11861 [Grimontella sp. AG753]|nr:hypothetical protein DFO55_11861 [Grimontella sp. AG753]
MKTPSLPCRKFLAQFIQPFICNILLNKLLSTHLSHRDRAILNLAFPQRFIQFIQGLDQIIQY